MDVAMYEGREALNDFLDNLINNSLVSIWANNGI